jgi:hypothetical protein
MRRPSFGPSEEMIAVPISLFATSAALIYLGVYAVTLIQTSDCTEGAGGGMKPLGTLGASIWIAGAFVLAIFLLVNRASVLDSIRYMAEKHASGEDQEELHAEALLNFAASSMFVIPVVVFMYGRLIYPLEKCRRAKSGPGMSFWLQARAGLGSLRFLIWTVVGLQLLAWVRVTQRLLNTHQGGKRSFIKKHVYGKAGVPDAEEGEDEDEEEEEEEDAERHGRGRRHSRPHRNAPNNVKRPRPSRRPRGQVDFNRRPSRVDANPIAQASSAGRRQSKSQSHPSSYKNARSTARSHARSR